LLSIFCLHNYIKSDTEMWRLCQLGRLEKLDSFCTQKEILQFRGRANCPTGP